MSESHMRGVVCDVLRAAGLDPWAVENPALPGTPDVNYIPGWVELKKAREWPVRPDTPLLIPHYTTQQKVVGFRRRWHGGQCHLLLQVNQDWLLFDSEIARKVVGCSPKNTLQQQARALWAGKASMQEGLVSCLFEPQSSLQESDSSSFGDGPAKPR